MKLSKEQQNIVQKLTYMLVDPSKCSRPILKGHLQRCLACFRKAFEDIYAVSFEAALTKKIVYGLSALKSVCCS
jgi:hypothetical protein